MRCIRDVIVGLYRIAPLLLTRYAASSSPGYTGLPASFSPATRLHRHRAIPDCPPPSHPLRGCIVAGLGGLEIVRRHAVEKLLELLDLVLPDSGVGLLVALVGDEEPGLGKHGFLDVDRDADPQ